MEKAHVTIRAYEERDFERLCQIHDPARKTELELAGVSGAFLPLTVAAEREGLFDYHVYVAELAGKAVGFVAFTEDELAWLYVDVNYTRRGIGSALIHFALDKMESEVSLEVLVGNTPAIETYVSCGFVIEQTLSGHMPGNEAYKVSAHVMKHA